MKILIADDNTQNRYLLQQILGSAAYQVTAASNGQQALALARAEPFDVIVSDILMPVMDGFQFCREVKQHPELKRIPFIFYSATYTDARDEALALSLGAERFLIKPQEPDVFLAALREVIEHAAKHPRPAPEKIEDESIFLQQYNQRLVQKLESKMNQVERALVDLQVAERRTRQLNGELEESNRRLKLEVAERLRAEQEVRELNADLELRVLERTSHLAAANQELEAFNSSVSHDLRGPLRQIGFLVNMLQARPAVSGDPEAGEHVREIGKVILRMDQLIKDLLEFSRLGRVPVRCVPVAMDTVVRTLVTELEPETRGRRIDWKIAPLPEVMGDPAMLRQVWVNLLGNALKYTRLRTPAVIEITHQTDGPRHVFIVRDNGVGFNSEYADKLFKVFQRLHSEEAFEGTGIGLANVKRIIDRHGGTVWAEGHTDEGATFYFSLPIKPKPSGS